MQEGSPPARNTPHPHASNATPKPVVVSAKQSLQQQPALVAVPQPAAQQQHAYINPHIPTSAFAAPSATELTCTLIGISGKVFAIPQSHIAKYLRIPAHTVATRFETLWTDTGHPITIFNRNNALLPVVRLATLLGLPLSYTHPTTGQQHEERRQNIWERRQRMPHPEVDEHDDGRPYLTRIDEDRRQTPYPDTELVVVTLPGITAIPQRFGIAVESIGPQKTVTLHPGQPPTGQQHHGKPASHTPLAFIGSTLVGNGVVAKVLDIDHLASMGHLNFGNITAEEQRRKKVMADAKAMLAKFPQWEPPPEGGQQAS